MNRETYGLIAENPIRLNSEKAAMGYLESLVTKHDGYHILFHRLLEFDFNIFDGKDKTPENTTSIYQVCTNDQTIITVFINTHFSECLWVPPAPFEFESEFVCICDKERTKEFDGEYTMVSVERKYINSIRENWAFDDYDKINPDSQEFLLYRSWGVNYKTPYFPNDLWNSFVKEHTFCISDLNEEELEEYNKVKAEMLAADFDL
jgi:hypothetical protein